MDCTNTKLRNYSLTMLLICTLILLFYHSRILLFYSRYQYQASAPITAINEHHGLSSVDYSGIISSYAVNKHKKIIFIKTHKTASTTVTSILWRHLCIRGGMNCFLPPIDHAGHIWDFADPEDWRIITSDRNYPFDVWLHHVKISSKLYDDVVPPSLLLKDINTDGVNDYSRIVLSIVRNPSERFISAWRWYAHGERLQVTLDQYVDDTMRLHNCKYLCFYPFIKDYAMKYRTGLDATTDELLGIYRYTSASKVIKRDSYHVFIDNLVDGRAFLLVADRFDESLLVLGKLLRMSVDQLRYYSHKVSYHHSNDELPYSDELKQQLLHLQPYDTYLYTLANVLLDGYIRAYGADFQHDLVELKSLVAQVHSLCYHSNDTESTSNPSICQDNKQLVASSWKLRLVD